MASTLPEPSEPPEQSKAQMNYFAMGNRPFLLQSPPCVGRIAPQDRGREETLSEATSAVSTFEGFSCLRDTSGSSGPEVPQFYNDFLDYVKAPEPLYSAFDCNEVQPWDPLRFQHIGKLQDAARNRGQVHQMLDHVQGKSVAVKRMPNDWVCTGPAEFNERHPVETELPWTDIGCISFLNKANYPHTCMLLGVYRDFEATSIVTELATEGDLFAWCGHNGPPPGPEREAAILPLVKQIVEGVAQLHEMSIVHRDLSLENILLSATGLPSGNLKIQVIDFGMTSTGRYFRNEVRGKASYQAPEAHLDEEYDGFLSDAFAVGVTIYAALMKDYPWQSTRPGGCKCFEFVRKYGFRAYLSKRKVRGTNLSFASCMSEDVIRLLEGLIAIDPAKRLTLGESAFAAAGRRSVWDEPWMGA